MATRDTPVNRESGAAGAAALSFAPMGAQRLLVFGGIALILIGMVLGDIFAVFILHPNADRIGSHLQEATQAVAAGDISAIQIHFARIGHLLENRGTKVDTHVHIIKFGYLSLILALVQPYVAFAERMRTRWAQFFLAGAVLLPVSVFCIHYAGLAYSPFQFIGWASVTADLGGLLVIVACLGFLAGLWRYLAGSHQATTQGVNLLQDQSWAARTLLAGGTLLILAGFLHGAYYAGVFRDTHEKEDPALLGAIADRAASGDLPGATAAVNQYGSLQGAKAVHLAAHSHLIEFGLMAILLAFVQPYVFLSERWKHRWVAVLLLGSVVLPVFVLLELRWGLIAGGIADVGGLLVILALIGMLMGICRHTGGLDAQSGAGR
ncbi:MAG: hypothetical protein L0Z50_38795 [Verrucomicrobiales bacterium]|nr:hypothetical protein [Verrucomicrobiales bacterium]